MTTVRSFQDCELGSVCTLLNINRADCAFFGSRKNHVSVSSARDLFAEGIVRIQNHRAIGANRLRQGTFFQRDRVSRSHELDVSDSDVGDDGCIRRCNSRERCNLAGMIHSDFPNCDFTLRGSF